MADSSDLVSGFLMGTESAGNNNNGSCNGGMFGGEGAWGWFIWIILIFAIFGWGNGGWGNNGGNGGNGMNGFLPYIAGSVTNGGALTRGELCQDMNFADVQAGVRSVNDAVNLGFANLNSTICHQQYDTAMQTNAIQAAVNGGFSALNATICQNAYENAGLINGLNNTIQSGFNASNIVAMQNQNALQAQIAQCCCDNQRALDGINYNMATNTCAITNAMNTNTRDIIDSQNAGTRAILDYLCQEKISDLQNENQALRLSASQQAQNNYLISQLRPTPVPAYPASSPCGLGNWSPAVLANGYGYGYNGGCGCGCA